MIYIPICLFHLHFSQLSFVHQLQLTLAEVGHNSSSQRISQHIYSCTEPVQQPVHRQDNSHRLTRQSNCVQHHHHGHKTSLRYSSSTNTGSSGSDGNCNDLSNVWLDVIQLSNEQSCHCFIKSCTIHVDCGSDRQNKPGNPWVD